MQDKEDSRYQEIQKANCFILLTEKNLVLNRGPRNVNKQSMLPPRFHQHLCIRRRRGGIGGYSKHSLAHQFWWLPSCSSPLLSHHALPPASWVTHMPWLLKGQFGPIDSPIPLSAGAVGVCLFSDVCKRFLLLFPLFLLAFIQLVYFTMSSCLLPSLTPAPLFLMGNLCLS